MPDEDIVQPVDGQDVSNQPQTSDASENLVESEPEITEAWESDKRWGKMWNHPNDAYKSYREMETKFGDISKKVKDYEEQIGELNQFKTQYSPYQDAIQFINHLASTPQYAPRLQEFVNQITDQMKRDRFGDLPDDVISKLQEIDELKHWKATQEYNREVEVLKSQYLTKISELEDFAKSKNLNVDMNEFLTFCSQNNISPERMKGAFIELAFDQIEEQIKGVSQEAAIDSINKSRAASTPSRNRTSRVSQNQASSYDEMLLNAYRKNN